MGAAGASPTASAASGASIAGLAMSTFGTIEKGYGEKAADVFRAGRLEHAAEYGKLNAQLTDTVMRENLNTTLANIDVMRAAAHTDPTSPTGAAVADYATKISDRQRLAALTNIKGQVEEDEASARYLRQAGDFAVSQAQLGASIGVASSLFKGMMG